MEEKVEPLSILNKYSSTSLFATLRLFQPMELLWLSGSLPYPFCFTICSIPPPFTDVTPYASAPKISVANTATLAAPASPAYITLPFAPWVSEIVGSSSATVILAFAPAAATAASLTVYCTPSRIIFLPVSAVASDSDIVSSTVIDLLAD